MDVVAWLLDADPAIRWQTLRDVVGAPPEAVAAARAEMTTSGWGPRLLDLQDDGRWAGGACFPSRTGWTPPAQVVGDPDGQPWTATLPTLRLLREFGVDPADTRVRAAIEGVRANCRWEYDDLPFFDGEVEPCINGGTVALGAYFGVPVDPIVERLLGEQLDDGGWNCEAENGSVRSSFHTTMCVLDGLVEYHDIGGDHDVAQALRRGFDYLLERHLMRRKSTGDVVDRDFLAFAFPPQWHYDVLSALDVCRRADIRDERMGEAVDLVRAKQCDDGRWLLETEHPGLQHFRMESVGEPSRWITLRATRVLRWWGGA